MDREIITTGDGSHSISIPAMQVTYHSSHGAIQESVHVFLEAGFKHVQKPSGRPLKIMEMGLGTGLNALLTLIESENNKTTVSYTALEFFPLENKETESLNYCELLNRPDLQTAFQQLHTSTWNQDITISDHFLFRKIDQDLKNIIFDNSFDLIYYDAFAPSVQPEVWTEEIFSKLYHATSPGGILVTYCSKSVVRRAMKSAGWIIEKISGPHGKREMVRAKRELIW